jgi:hypothetical protein
LEFASGARGIAFAQNKFNNRQFRLIEISEYENEQADI